MHLPYSIVRWPEFESSIVKHDFVLNAFHRVVDEIQDREDDGSREGSVAMLLLDADGVILARGGSPDRLRAAVGQGLIPAVKLSSRDLAAFPHRLVELTSGREELRVGVALISGDPEGARAADGAASVLLSSMASLLRRELELVEQEQDRSETSFQLEKLSAFHQIVVATERSRVTTLDLIRGTLDFIRPMLAADRAALVFPQARDDMVELAGTVAQDLAGLPIVRRVFAERLPVRVSLHDRDPARRELLEALAAAAALIVPVLFDGGACGAAVVVARVQPVPFTEREAELLAFVSVQIGLALENTDLREQLEQRLRALTTELELAQSMQQAILPAEPLRSPDVEICGFSRPARHVGGDFFDYWQLADGSYVCAVGDIMGKGVGAALLMSLLRTQVRVVTSEREFGLPVLRRLIEVTWDDFARAGAMATLQLLRFEAAQRRLTVLNAGHHPPLLFRGGKWALLEGARGTALGLSRALPRYQAVISEMLAAGDIVVSCSDGLVEAAFPDRKNVQIGGLLQLVGAIEPHGAVETLGRLQRHVSEVLGRRSPEDDITVVALGVPALEQTG